MGLYHTCEHNPHGYPFVALWTYSIIRMEKWKPTHPIPNKERCSHPNPLEGDGTSRAGRLMRIFMHHESRSKVLK